MPDTSFAQGVLAIRRLTLFQAVMIMVGGNVGAAILSLPYAARAAGYPGAACVAIVTTLFSLVSHLYVAEIMLRTRRPTQLVGLMREYMHDQKNGALWVLIMALLTAGIAIPSLTAYVIGGAEIIAAFIPVNPVIAGLMFVVPGAAVVWLGLKATGIAQQWASMIMGAALLVFAFTSTTHPDFEFARLARFVPGAMAAALPVGIFTSMSQALVPEVVRGLSHEPDRIPGVIFVSLAINLGFLMVFCAAIFGLQPFDAISEVVTVSWGRALGVPIWAAINSFALLALLTSFWSSALSAMGNVIEALGFKSETALSSRVVAFVITVAPSVALVFTQRFDFGDMISTAGAVGGVVLAVLPIPILLRARARNQRQPEFTCGVLFSVPFRVSIVLFYVGVLAYAAITML
jgi:amino acid permease